MKYDGALRWIQSNAAHFLFLFLVKALSPTFHVYHNFRLKNFYILEKQPIIVEFLADFVSRGSVVKTEQKPTVGRSFDNNSRERGKSG